IVFRPVSYLLFRFTHVTTVLITIKDQITGLGKGSTDLSNNALSTRYLTSPSICFLRMLIVRIV
ncbi:hypothetical protein, partial [uncultured Vibrio sp.]|uniref:hypothetical protein n=1 Tax=uncultured Vibrio sp. TaxID=114054 RepID=UPI00262B68B5